MPPRQFRFCAERLPGSGTIGARAPASPLHERSRFAEKSEESAAAPVGAGPPRFFRRSGIRPRQQVARTPGRRRDEGRRTHCFSSRRNRESGGRRGTELPGSRREAAQRLLAKGRAGHVASPSRSRNPSRRARLSFLFASANGLDCRGDAARVELLHFRDSPAIAPAQPLGDLQAEEKALPAVNDRLRAERGHGPPRTCRKHSRSRRRRKPTGGRCLGGERLAASGRRLAAVSASEPRMAGGRGAFAELPIPPSACMLRSGAWTRRRAGPPETGIC